MKYFENKWDIIKEDLEILGIQAQVYDVGYEYDYTMHTVIEFTNEDDMNLYKVCGQMEPEDLIECIVVIEKSKSLLYS